jgi:hypothetical protein
MRQPRLPHFTIRAFAVICVAVTSAYVMWMGYRLNETLSGPGWCATALGAGKASSADGTPIKGLEACVGLLTIQLKSISTNSHILLGSVALCLSVLIVRSNRNEGRDHHRLDPRGRAARLRHVAAPAADDRGHDRRPPLKPSPDKRPSKASPTTRGRCCSAATRSNPDPRSRRSSSAATRSRSHDASLHPSLPLAADRHARRAHRPRG